MEHNTLTQLFTQEFYCKNTVVEYITARMTKIQLVTLDCCPPTQSIGEPDSLPMSWKPSDEYKGLLLAFLLLSL